MARAAIVGLVAAIVLITVRKQDTDNSGQAVPSAAPVSEVKLEMVDEKPTRTILARYGDDPDWRVLFTVWQEAGSVEDPQLVEVGERGDRCVVFGTGMPVDGHCLFALNEDGTERWRLDLSDSRPWPDCAPSGFWKCLALAAGDIDGQPGDELIVAAADHQEYPTRVSIVDPRTHEIGPTFWHPGHISSSADGIRIVPKFFDGRRPAILAWGSNNKLDGFDEEKAGDDPWATGWDIVRVLLILDPADMEGIGPPRSDRFPDLPVARPYAYAFLDAPASETHEYRIRGQSERRTARPDEVAYIVGAGVGAYPESDDTRPWFTVTIASPGNSAIGTTLRVDRHLTLRGVVAQRYDQGHKEYWSARWRPVIQEGQYLNR